MKGEGYMKLNWDIVPRDEQETNIHLDYETKTINFYTNRKSTANRIIKRLGEPDGIDTYNGRVNGIRYSRNLNDKNIKPLLSMTTVIGNFRHLESEEQ